MTPQELKRLIESESLSESELAALSDEERMELRRIMLSALRSHLVSRRRPWDEPAFGPAAAAGGSPEDTPLERGSLRMCRYTAAW